MKWICFKITEDKKKYIIWNIKDEQIGRLEKVRVGAWESWCLFLNENYYVSASCLDEIREMIRELNGKKVEK